MTTTFENTAGLTRNTASLDTLRTRINAYLTYRRTVRELSKLSDRTLADLGLSRSMIKTLAREAAYGA